VRRFILALALMALLAAAARADDIWARRIPQAYLFNDYRARNIGELLTIIVSENTDFQENEKRELDKETQTRALFNLNANSTITNGTARSVKGTFDAQANSQRKFDSKANSMIDRRLADRMTVVVMGVMPNGNLIVEGTRTRVVAREWRTLRVTGIVRPADIGPFNTVQSQFIANFQMIYEGRGPESSYTNHGWGGRIMNVLWPF